MGIIWANSPILQCYVFKPKHHAHRACTSNESMNCTGQNLGYYETHIPLFANHYL